MNTRVRPARARTWGPWAGVAAVLAALAVVSSVSRGAGADAGASATAHAPRTPWPKSVLEAARDLPIQEGGRVMPLSYWARYTLLRLNQRASVKDTKGRTLEPVEWALDVMFRPEEAAKYEVFAIDTSEILDTVGYTPSEERRRRRQEAKEDPQKKRDRYSYFDLADVANALHGRAVEYDAIDPKKQSTVQGGTVALARNVMTFVALVDLLEAARFEIPLEKVPALRPVFGGAASVRASDVLAHLDDLRSAGADEKDPRVRDAGLLLSNLGQSFSAGRLFAVFPPMGDHATEEGWYTPRALFERTLETGRIEAGHLDTLRRFEAAARAAETDDVGGFETSFRGVRDATTARAASRGEGRWLGLEAWLIRIDPFFWASTLYLLAFLLVAASWLRPTAWIVRGAWALLIAGLVLHSTGIAVRCVIQNRPPVKTLYETTLFISALGVAGAMILERVSRRGFGFALAPLFGVIGLMISIGYERISASDEMRPLEAVLDTNFWLTTHVLCISLGYCVTLLASFVAHIHVATHVFDWRASDPEFRRSLGRATYGIMAFGLLLSTVGTILGGVWANDSWGRFWGWDPKENGALMIVLAQLAVLHGRMGGMLSPLGVSLGTIATGGVVAFSWWGVNLLGVGLHSYGFTAGLWTSLLTFWGIELVVLAAGIFVRRAR